ncbi:hydrogenase formation protein HypD [Candidatus Woesearchaeota archaeon]|nr:hydrogenase formation protein HypD [Candidatus Woesearchaeota archaeon]
MNRYIGKIKSDAKKLGRIVTIMEICGGHTNTIMKYGIRDLLPKNIRLISGPGCPVCVTTQFDIDCMIEIAKNVPVATYGDMMKVPGSNSSLEDAKANGAKIFEVYSAEEVLELKKNNPSVVFFGIGFETTAPMTAFLLKKKICVYSAHKLVPPALTALLDGDVRIDGFIEPGHVSTIIGTKPYHKIKIPQVVAGFTAERILRAVSILVELIAENKDIVINGYPEAVKEEGNTNAQRMLNEYFKVVDSGWRGLGIIPKSGLEVKDGNLNAKIKYKNIIKEVPPPKKTACRCGEVLKGLIEPAECPLYKKACTPEDPKGACMVSAEGSCAIAYKYGR